VCADRALPLLLQLLGWVLSLRPGPHWHAQSAETLSLHCCLLLDEKLAFVGRWAKGSGGQPEAEGQKALTAGLLY